MANKCCIKVFDDGPYVAEGLGSLLDARNEEIPVSDKTALCRCGASGNKPYCDGTHKKIGFSDRQPASHSETVSEDGPREIKVLKKGPYEVPASIALDIEDDMGLSSDNPYYLCRCGASENKPFCDGSHKRINFSDE